MTRQPAVTARALVRAYSNLPEPPTPQRQGRPAHLNFKAPVPPAPYRPVMQRSPQQTKPAPPLYNPTKETLDTNLKELADKCEIYK